MLISARREEYYETEKVFKKIIVTYKMGKEIIASGNTEIKNQKFHCL